MARHSMIASSTSSSSHTPSSHAPSYHRLSHPHSPTLTFHTPPLESAELLLKFLKVSYQLERLIVEWGLKVLGKRAIKNDKDLAVVESAYRAKVFNWAQKWVAKQQRRELTRMQMETVSFGYFLQD